MLFIYNRWSSPCLRCYCCCCRSHINSHNQVRGHRTGSSHSGAEEYPRENTHTTQARWYTHISQLTQFMPPPETYKSEIGSQSTMCQVQAGPYVSLLTPGGTKYSDCHLSKTNTYILHVVSITTSYTMSGRPGGVSGCPRAWYRSVSRLQAPRVHTRINSWGLFLVHKLTCGKRESVS